MLTRVEEALRSLFGSEDGRPAPTVAVHVLHTNEGALREWTEGECLAVAGAVRARQVEFASGRQAARRALRELGMGFQEIPRDPSTRGPVWPKGVIGSISHSEGLCAAACANTDPWRSVGLDVEPDEALEDALVPVICTDAERAMLRGPDAGRRLRWHFSAKEAFYKAQHPLTRRFLEFTDVELTWHIDETRTRARFEVRSTVPESAEIAALGEGRLVVVDGWVLTAFVVPASARET